MSKKTTNQDKSDAEAGVPEDMSAKPTEGNELPAVSESPSTTEGSETVNLEIPEPQAPKKSWQGKGHNPMTDDPLLGCLMLLTQYHNNPFSARALTAGLPLEDNQLTPNLFIRAAERADLSAQIVKRPLEKFSSRFLPAVLLLEDKEACVLTELNVESGQAQIIQPETGKGVTEISIEALTALYTGYALVASPVYKFSGRSEQYAPKRPRNWFWSVVTDSWRIYSEVLVASFLVNAFALASPLFVMNVYDRVVPNNAFSTLWVLAIGVILVFGFDFLMRLLRSYFIDHASHQIDSRLSASIFEQLMGLKMDRRPGSVGVLANNLQAFEAFREFITSASVTVLVDLPFVVLFLLVVWLLGGSMVWVPIIAIPLVLLVGICVQFPLSDLLKKSYRYSSEKQATLYEALSGAETIKTLGAESPIQRRWEQSAIMSSKIGIKTRQYSSFAVNFSVFVQSICSIMVVILGVYKISNGDLSVGALIACTILTGRALAPMAQVAGLVARFYQSKTALNSVDQLMQEEVERPKGKTLLHHPQLDGNIEFKNVSFNYPEQEVSAVSDISFRIKAGDRVGIIGRIGSGKTTVLKLLMGLYQPSDGNILMDGIEIQQLDPAEMRQNIGYVPQDIMLFYGTIKDNVVMGVPHVNDGSIVQAVKLSGVDRFVSRNPKGFDMQVGERGKNLSGGQRQSIAIARALLLEPSLLVMDEPTNSMDDRTESLFKQNLQHYLDSTKKTLLLSTHKGGMLSLVDRLIVMEGGRMVAYGPKDQVLEALAQGKIKIS